MTCDFCGDPASYSHTVTNGLVTYGPEALLWCRSCLTLYYLGLLATRHPE